MNPVVPDFAADRRGFAPSINRRPRRLQRPRKRAPLPAGSTYVGRPTLWGNPFAGRAKIGHARSVILFAAWLRGELSPRILASAGFSNAEIDTLIRRRHSLVRQLPALAGHDLQCWCPTTSAWCHADVLLDAANGTTR